MKKFRWNRAEQLSFLVLILSVVALKSLSFKLWSREDRQPSAATEVAAVESPVARQPVQIDLNRVDSATLVEVRGIGPYTASRILRYRRQLGGFVRLEQLDEIKGLYPENLTTLKSQALIDTSVIQRLSVNGSPVDTLAAHPYMSWRQARALDGLRRRRGRIRTIYDLSFLEEFNSADLVRLAPYLQW